MAAFYQDFTTTTRTTEPEINALIAQLKALDASAGVQHDPGTSTYRLKKSTAWTGPQIAAAQNVLETAPALTLQSAAQAWVDAMPIPEKALLLTIIDELNHRRQWDSAFKAATAAATSLADLKSRVAQLPDAPDITVAAAIQAVRDKAGSL